MPNYVTIDRAATIQVMARIGEATAALAVEIEAAVHAAGQTCLDNAQANAPVLTGEMRDTMELTTGVMVAEVTTNVNYSKFVENGHQTRSGTFVPPQPFLGPAADLAAAQLQNALSGLIP